MENELLFSESYENKYERGSHYVGISIWHFEWCTKYRYKMFQKQEYLKLAEACIRKAAFEHEIKIISLSVMPEHIHCVVQVSLSFSASKCLQILKGRSSYLFFKLHVKAELRYPRHHLWSKGKFASSVGFTDLETVNHYEIEDGDIFLTKETGDDTDKLGLADHR